MSSYRELTVWQKAIELVVCVYIYTKKLACIPLWQVNGNCVIQSLA